MVVWKEESNPSFLKDQLDDTEQLLDEPLDGSRQDMGEAGMEQMDW